MNYSDFIKSYSAAALVQNAPVATRTGELPNAWGQITYPPGYPIQPLPRPEESEIPREIDFPLSINATLQPRTGWGILPFGALAEAFDNIYEVSQPAFTVMREMNSFTPRLVNKLGDEVSDHDMKWIVKHPDGITPWSTWLSRFLQSMQAFEAPCFYIQYEHGNLKGLRYVDGETIFIITDEHGEIPAPDARASEDPLVVQKYLIKRDEWLRKYPTRPLPTKTPAYAQVIKGTPFGWYSRDELFYRPRFTSYKSPYGRTYIENSYAWILIVANLTGFELSYYKEGNLPDGWMESPEDWSVERLQTYELGFNARQSSGPAERMRTRFVPHGFRWQATKKADFPEKLYNRALDNISLAAGLPPSESGKIPGQGLGGRGFKDLSQNQLYRVCLIPNKNFIEGSFNEVLSRFGVNDVRVELALPQESADPEATKKTALDLFMAGVYTMNDALGELGRKPVKGGDIHIVISGGSVIVLEDYLAGKRDAPGQGGPALPGDGQAPVNSVPQGDEPANKKDYEPACRASVWNR